MVIRGCKPDGTKLGFGRYGTQSCRAGRLSYRATEAARRAIIGHFHRAMSGQFRKNGKIWVRVFADIPITGSESKKRMIDFTICVILFVGDALFIEKLAR
ncbi:putative ribosomal protein L16 [Medicago truncatula]|uniref:Large ribosomal subunit protein uL16m n=1 Tax=Medicago truncatula TaxID=3880 RepID=A0A396GWW2_MEDTR|nr:putative ribosomal protein L16 [Medicago truncatula]